MKKLSTVVLVGLLFAIPVAARAAYVNVNYELDISPRSQNLITSGYYYMLIDAYVCSQYDFNDEMSHGANLDNISRSAILQEGVTTKDNFTFNQSTSTDGAGVYFAVFNTAQFGNDAFDYWYSLSSVLPVSDTTSYAHGFVNSYTDVAGTVNYTIPEPSSGLLILVGCSLLALKRRRED